MSNVSKKQTYEARRRLRRRRGIGHSFVVGLATMLTLDTHKEVIRRYKPDSPNKALRGDFEQLGHDMQVVIRREREREEAGS